MRASTKKELLFVGSFVFLFYIACGLLFLVHPNFDVGIILTEEAKTDFAELTQKGFEYAYPSYLQAEILPEKMDVSQIRTDNETYFLNADFFTEAKRQNLTQSGYDYYLIVTSLPIKDWDKGGYGVFGEAEPNTSTVLSSTFYFMNGSAHANESIMQTGVHEILHMLGYVHNPFNRNGIMQYITKSTTLKLIPYYVFQLPMRIHIAKAMGEDQFERIVLATAIGATLLIVPLILLIEMVLRGVDRHIAKRWRVSVLVSSIAVIVGIASIHFYNYSFASLILPAVFMSAVHAVYWEYIRWTRQTLRAR